MFLRADAPTGHGGTTHEQLRTADDDRDSTKAADQPAATTDPPPGG